MAKFFITVAIDYINDRAHLGHAYEKIAADVLARWHRAKGDEVLFTLGTDENSQKTVYAAEKAKKDTLEYANEMAKIYQETWQKLNISYDDFIRTTEKRHKKAVEEFFKKLYASGNIYKGKYKGYYCFACEEFKKKEDLVNGKCPEHDKIPELIEEENYFFRLGKYERKLLNYIENNPEFIQPASAKNEVLNFINEGLEDISISRPRIPWGIPLPFDSSHISWVWIDALINYLTVCGFPNDLFKFKKLWPADIHIIGKNITRFHCLIWPVLLWVVGVPLPKKIFAHGFITIEGEKMSKTRKNVIDPLFVTKKYGVDALRYSLLREIPFGQDGDFSEEALKRRYNADLANGLGNLVQRVSVMLVKYFNGNLEKIETAPKELEGFQVTEVWQKIEKSLTELQFHEALTFIWQIIDRANKYIEKKKPWTYQRSAISDQQSVLGTLIEVIREISEMLLPFMPETASKIQKQFQGPKIEIQKPLFPKI